MKKNEEEKIEEVEKSNKMMKTVLLVIIGVVLFAGCFVIGYNFGSGSEKEEGKTETKEEGKTNENDETKEEEKVDNTISDTLRKELDKKIELTYKPVMVMLLWSDTASYDNVLGKNDEAFLAYATYRYYLYKTGAKEEKFTTKDSNFATCYEQAQHGYCYVVSKADIEKYNKELYNLDMKVFNLGDYTTTRGDKVYVAPVDYGSGYTYKNNGASSVVRDGNTIEYIANHVIEDINDNKDIKYIFKANEDGNFYLYSFEVVADKSENKEDTKVDNTISAELRKDLDKKVELTRFYATGHFLYPENQTETVVISTIDDYYDSFIWSTYQYYIYKTGKVIDKWSIKDTSYGPCYYDSQNGYCYPVDKTEFLKYEKDIYNRGSKIFELELSYALVKGDKIYVTDVPGGGHSVELKNVVSVERKNDTIEYVANYDVTSGDKRNMNIKYIFKTNTDGNFYLHSFEKM